jgi:hypothetical protein
MQLFTQKHLCYFNVLKKIKHIKIYLEINFRKIENNGKVVIYCSS